MGKDALSVACVPRPESEARMPARPREDARPLAVCDVCPSMCVGRVGGAEKLI
jgi:hypothetical protein